MKSFGSRASGERLERMQASPGWDGQAFRNRAPVDPALRVRGTEMPSISEMLCPKPPRVPEGPLPLLDPRETWQRTPDSGLRATWLGHSTVLLEIDGVKVLTDPVWGPRASPFGLVGPKRFAPMPVRLRDMPEVDVIVISHDHYDHLDYPTIRALRASRGPFVTSLGVGAHLQGWGIEAERITELDWWESTTVAGTGLTITATPSQHFSGRGLKTRNSTLWSGLVMRGSRHAVFFSGDTGLTDQYLEIRRRLGPFDLALLEVGAHNPAWGDIHLGPDHAVKALAMLGNPAFLPVHWGTFCLAMHAWDEPAERLLALTRSATTPILLPRLGEALEPVHASPARPWWREVTLKDGPATPVVDAEREAQLLARLPGQSWPLD